MNARKLIVDLRSALAVIRCSAFGVRRSAFAAVVLLGVAQQGFAQSDAEFLKANQDYAAGNFQNAIKGYEALVQARQFSANLFYNLGNAYFRAGDFGAAILNYERALALDRHHAEADANLQIVREETRALELTPAPLERFLRFARRSGEERAGATADQYAIAAAVVLWVGLFCLAALIFSRRRVTGAIALSIFAFAISAAAIFAAYRVENGATGKSLAIVTGNAVEARLATADNANTVLALPPGSEIKILSTRGDWIYAALPNNLHGWLPAKSAKPVRL
jgi:tetratricopeptide (TPR) repeat protein